MIETKYICDLCGKVHDNKEKMWTVALNVKMLKNNYAQSSGKEQMWCHDCIVKRSMVDWLTEEPHPEKIEPAPTFGEQIEYLIQQMIDQEIQNQ